MQYDNNVHAKQGFDEVAIAKFSNFQIAIPSKTQTIPRKIFSTWVPLPKRIYHSRGGIIWNKKLSFTLSEFKIQNLFEQSPLFPELKRLAIGMPISFEVKSSMPLPTDLRKQATFTCQVPGEKSTYYSIFRDLIPKFVKISPYQSIVHLTDQISFISMLKQEQ